MNYDMKMKLPGNISLLLYWIAQVVVKQVGQVLSQGLLLSYAAVQDQVAMPANKYKAYKLVTA